MNSTIRQLLTSALVAGAAASLLSGCDVAKGACVYRMGSGQLAATVCIDDFTEYQCKNGAGTMIAFYDGDTCKQHGYP